MKYPVLGVDVDGVLAEQNGAFTAFIESHHEIDFPVSKVTSRNPDIPEIESTYVDQIRLALSIHGPDFYKEMAPIPGAPEAIQELSSKYHIKIVTHRNEDAKNATVEWFSEHNIPYDSLQFEAPSNKGKIEIDHLIDDYPQNILHAQELGCAGIIFLRNSHIQKFTPELTPITFPPEMTLDEIANSPKKQWKWITAYLQNDID